MLKTVGCHVPLHVRDLSRRTAEWVGVGPDVPRDLSCGGESLSFMSASILRLGSLGDVSIDGSRDASASNERESEAHENIASPQPRCFLSISRAVPLKRHDQPVHKVSLDHYALLGDEFIGRVALDFTQGNRDAMARYKYFDHYYNDCGDKHGKRKGHKRSH